MARVLVARLDSMGDVLLAGPAVRALSESGHTVTLLTSSIGAEIATLLPGVDHTLTFEAPWVLADPPPATVAATREFVQRIEALRIERAVVSTSFHQSPLPLALLLRLAGVGHIGAISVDHAGSLLDVRHHVDDDIHEVERNLELLRACGYGPPRHDRLVVDLSRTEPPSSVDAIGDDYVVVHPGAAAPARTASASLFSDTVAALVARRFRVVVTGSQQERALANRVSAAVPHGVTELAGELDVADLAHVLSGASVVITGNTGPAHLAAAVGTPVVSLYPPTVPWARWHPWRVPTVRLGSQDIECRGCRSVRCPFHGPDGQPCLRDVRAADVVAAAEQLVDREAVPA